MVQISFLNDQGNMRSVFFFALCTSCILSSNPNNNDDDKKEIKNVPNREMDSYSYGETGTNSQTSAYNNFLREYQISFASSQNSPQNRPMNARNEQIVNHSNRSNLYNSSVHGNAYIDSNAQNGPRQPINNGAYIPANLNQHPNIRYNTSNQYRMQPHVQQLSNMENIGNSRMEGARIPHILPNHLHHQNFPKNIPFQIPQQPVQYPSPQNQNGIIQQPPPQFNGQVDANLDPLNFRIPPSIPLMTQYDDSDEKSTVDIPIFVIPEEKKDFQSNIRQDQNIDPLVLLQIEHPIIPRDINQISSLLTFLSESTENLEISFFAFMMSSNYFCQQDIDTLWDDAVSFHEWPEYFGALRTIFYPKDLPKNEILLEFFRTLPFLEFHKFIYANEKDRFSLVSHFVSPFTQKFTSLDFSGDINEFTKWIERNATFTEIYENLPEAGISWDQLIRLISFSKQKWIQKIPSILQMKPLFCIGYTPKIGLGENEFFKKMTLHSIPIPSDYSQFLELLKEIKQGKFSKSSPKLDHNEFVNDILEFDQKYPVDRSSHLMKIARDSYNVSFVFTNHLKMADNWREFSFVFREILSKLGVQSTKHLWLMNQPLSILLNPPAYIPDYSPINAFFNYSRKFIVNSIGTLRLDRETEYKQLTVNTQSMKILDLVETCSKHRLENVSFIDCFDALWRYNNRSYDDELAIQFIKLRRLVDDLIFTSEPNTNYLFVKKVKYIISYIKRFDDSKDRTILAQFLLNESDPIDHDLLKSLADSL